MVTLYIAGTLATLRSLPLDGETCSFRLKRIGLRLLLTRLLLLRLVQVQKGVRDQVPRLILFLGDARSLNDLLDSHLSRVLIRGIVLVRDDVWQVEGVRHPCVLQQLLLKA